MQRRVFTIIRLALVCFVIAGLALAGCGGRRSAAPSEGQAGAAPTAALEATAEPEEPTAPPEESGSEAVGEEAEVTGALDNLLKLAPLHMRSVFVATDADGETTEVRFEGDLDAKGNQHVLLYGEDDQATELYVVDGKLYIGVEGSQFMALGEVEAGESFAFVALYGGAYLLAYNDLGSAKRVGSETVNGFQTDKYEVKLDLASFGLGGLAAEAQGAEFKYEGYAWVESSSGALVRSQVDWTAKASAEEKAETWHAEFDATKATVEEIQAPENVLSLEG